MAFLWKNFLKTAQLLISGNTPIDEEHRRASVSRAYYAVFGTVMIFVKNHYSARFTNQFGKNSHNNLIIFLKGSDDQDLFELGNRLGALKERRKDADYEPLAVIDLAFAIDTNEKAQEALFLFEEIKDNPPTYD